MRKTHCPIGSGSWLRLYRHASHVCSALYRYDHLAPASLAVRGEVFDPRVRPQLDQLWRFAQRARDPCIFVFIIHHFPPIHNIFLPLLLFLVSLIHKLYHVSSLKNYTMFIFSLCHSEAAGRYPEGHARIPDVGGHVAADDGKVRRQMEPAALRTGSFVVSLLRMTALSCHSGAVRPIP